ncbi:MAG: RHS repeat-associated core domain-containing protein, partial [Eubacterium sp.]|nr:RHS repeat-associated core domain-containing protein [Eubacterium sp.]
YSYETDDDNRISSDSVVYCDNTALSSTYTYDDNGNITDKHYSYKELGEDFTVGFVNEYDSKDRITSFGYDEPLEHYTYDDNDQLVRVDSRLYENNYTSTYTYDSRGNITSKNIYDYTRSESLTLPTKTTTFTYANTGWKDQLVAVNDIELTYDEIGNVLTYGDKNYTWNSGRHLESITDGTNAYSYTYDENGIRTSKTVNGVTTYFNTRDGVILSQTDGTNTMFFQYDSNGIPLGFIYNGSRYLYMTNQMGDVVAITDKNGDVLVEYNYDEWGIIESIKTVYENDEFSLAIANANPLRYRGYYYDNETGYYYLQSRYYDPSICRFINADVPEIVKASKNIENGINLFAYCNNNPTNKSDPSGMVAPPLVAAAVAVSIGSILLAMAAAIGISWALATIIQNIDYSFVVDVLNDLYTTHKLKTSFIKSLVVGCMKLAYSFAKKAITTTSKAVNTKAKVLSKAISIAVADAKIKTVMKQDKKHDYWVAYSYRSVIYIGKGLSRSSAISRVKGKLSIFARRKQQARTIAWEAGGKKTPYGPENHCKDDSKGFYWHYHVYKQHTKNSAHTYYL